MAIRLTKQAKDDAVRALLKATFERREEKARKKLHTVAVRALKKKCGTKYRTLAALPKGWAFTRNMLHLNLGGEYRNIALLEDVPVPGDRSVYTNFEARDEHCIAIKAAHDDLLAISKERRDLERRANEIVSRFQSAEKLAEAWPLIAPHLPKKAAPVPALPIEEVTEQFKRAKAA